MTNPSPVTLPGEVEREAAEDMATLDVFLAAYEAESDAEVLASVIVPTDDLLTLGALRRILRDHRLSHPVGQGVDVERIWTALKERVCADPENAKRCVMVSRDDLAAALSQPVPVASPGYEAVPSTIGRLHRGERVSDGETLCSWGHDVPAGHPLYWPQMISQYDDSDPCCIEHAIEQYVSETGYGLSSAVEAAISKLNTGLAETAKGVLKWLASIDECDLAEVVADGGITAWMVVQQEAREQALRLRASLRATAQATHRHGCTLPNCTRIADHDGDCAAYPTTDEGDGK